MTVSGCSVVITLTVLLAIQPVCCTQTTYVVKPTPDTPCPSEPCLTLSEYAQDAGPLFTSNTTMVFLPGDHRLYNDMGITNITTFTMVGDSATLTSNIVCTGPAAFIFQNISYLKIHALELSYCGSATLAAVQLIAIPKFELSNSAFLNSRNTSLMATGSDLTITETIFHGSSSTGLWLWGCTAGFLESNVFSNNLRSGVRSYWSIITFNGTVSFVNNSGEYGGGMLAEQSIVHSSEIISFTHNRVSYYGGGMYLNNSVVSCDGGIILVLNSAETGGGICALGGSSLMLRGSITFTYNSATIGGGIGIEGSSLSCKGLITFASNSAELGGGISTMLTCYCNVCKFINNSATEWCGGVYTHNGNDLILSGNTTFVSNLALHGGGVFSQWSSLSFYGYTTFVGNYAESHGGGLAIKGSTTNFEGTNVFADNSAMYGGGVHAESSSGLTVKGTTIIARNSAYDGAGINTINSSLNFCKEMITFENNSAKRAFNSTVWWEGISTFINNSAEYAGGGSFVKNLAESAGGGLMAYHSTIVCGENSTLILRKNSANRGGGIFVLESYMMLSGTVVFTSNSATRAGAGICLENSILNVKVYISFTSNYAEFRGGGIKAFNSSVTCEGICIFINNSAEYGGGVSVSDSTDVLYKGNSTFTNNSAMSGGGIDAAWGSTLTFSGNTTFISNKAKHGAGIAMGKSRLSCEQHISLIQNIAEYAGGGFSAYDSSIVCGNGSTLMLINNSAEYGGGLIAQSDSSIVLSGSTVLIGNSAVRGAGIILLEHSRLYIQMQISFINNRAVYTGGGVRIESSSVTCDGICSFTNNSANYGGGVSSDFKSVLTWKGITVFSNNSADHGAGMIVQHSTLSFNGYIRFKNNLAAFGGGLKSLNSTVNIKANSVLVFINNSAKIGGAILVTNGSNLTVIGNSTYINNTAKYSGGAVSAGSGSNVNFSGYSMLYKNSAEYGGGVHLTNSNLQLLATTVFRSNSAINGGGVHGTMATITLNGNTTFDGNSATLNGGGLSASSTSKCFISVNKTTYFTGNHAGQYGGAVFIADDPFIYCTSVADWNLWEECFFQFPEWKIDNAACKMTNNTASKAGGAVYGGMVDSCKLAYAALHRPGHVFNKVFSITQNVITSVISSDPYQVCTCSSGQPDCSTYSISITVYPGETFLVPVVAVGQRYGTVPAVVKSSLEDELTKLDSLQEAQSVNNTCTALQYTIFSKNSKEKMTLEAEGPCLEMGEPLIINITLLQCPTGFMLSSSTKGCTCEKRLQKYTNICNINSRKIDRDGQFWVGVDNGFEGTILHPHCPFDYCKSHPVSFALNETDLECSYDRTGLLCGGCQPGLSNVLGSSRCIKCSGVYLSLLIPFAVAGIALVAFLLLCKLTVTVGSINGLIFYANIIAVNHSVFLPSGQQSVLTIFIAWLNLDMGIETCFYDGMDAYARTWLQFAFPLYVWALVGTIVILSHHYGAVARMFGRNPIAVLATLFLLSYAKLLRTIIAVLSFTYLEYPDGAEVAVWLYDGNVRYLKGKHIPLFLTAMLVLLLLFLPYTLLLLFGQWIQAHSEKRIFSWISDYRVKPFLDAYHAPYRNKYRYWPGLLLVLRCILFLVFAFNILGNPSVNLLAISVCTLVIVIFARFTIINHYFDAINVSYLLNIGVLATATLYVRSAGGRQEILVYTSISIAFTTFIGILVYHIITQIRDSHAWREVIWPTLQRMRQRTPTSDVYYASNTDTQVAEPEIVSHTPSSTFIDLRELLLEDN